MTLTLLKFTQACFVSIRWVLGTMVVQSV